MNKRNQIFAVKTCSRFISVCSLPRGILFFTTLSTRCWVPPISGCKKVPWPILSGGRFSSKSVSSSWEGTCKCICCNRTTQAHNRTTKQVTTFFKSHTSERCSDNFSPQFLAFSKAGSRYFPWPTFKSKLHQWETFNNIHSIYLNSTVEMNECFIINRLYSEVIKIVKRKHTLTKQDLFTNKIWFHHTCSC